MVDRHYDNTGRSAENPPQVTQPSGFFFSLTDAQRNALLELGSGCTYRAGQVMMREGNPGRAVIIILAGLAKITALSEHGKEILLGFRGNGDLIGEMAVLSSERRSATVTAATSLNGRLILAESFVAYLERSPQVANRVSDIMASKLREANRRRVEYSSYPVQCRVARELTELALAFGHAEEDAWRIGPEITQADLASLAAASVRTIEKVLRAFESDGFVVRRRRDLIVTDIGALQARARCESLIRPGRDRTSPADGKV
jgi:CRP/FNR family cyclic AMP-dependent transcriptional regulator